ncbi:MAG: exodeoxyribonuclease I [Porticoccaceae bacterium]
MTTLYWHDYETSGIDPARDRPLQFAGVRTDEELNPIGSSLRLYCQPDPDLLPQPAACLLTGITPQLAAREGLPEPEFAARILAELGAPGTCGVGYNSLRFDDEFTRFLLYRNFHDPYEREWRGGNSRWDILDMLRLARALRPEGLNWPEREDGSASFRLADLATANGIVHDHAHDALSDVLATIALARRVRECQPELYRYVYAHRHKRQLQPLLDPARRRPLLHVSGRLPRERGYTALVLPLARDPGNANAIICFDLQGDADALIALDAEAIRARVFTPAAELAAGIDRLPLKAIHLNRCPVVATPKLLDAAAARRLGIDLGRCETNWHKLSTVDLTAKLAQVFAPPAIPAPVDAEAALYAGFLSDAERGLLPAVRAGRGEELDPARLAFHDPRYRELLFRYRARHFPATLTPTERESWRDLCRWRLTDPASGYLGLAAFRTELSMLGQQPADPARRALLEELQAWGETVAARHGLGGGAG